MKQNPKHFVPKQKSDFRKMAIELAVQRALNAQNHNKWLGPKCRNEKEKAAWADCLKLYEDTIAELNHTIDSNTKCTQFDAQTWLSTALTNLETCKAGFKDLGVSDFVLPLMSNNVSKLIRNTLALKDNASSTLPQTYKDGFPSWVKAGDRKLLQTSSPSPNLVVAQDGSGNHRTIKAALDAAAKRSGSRRFVIRIKSGVYRENLDIGKKLKNIMLVGDGLRNTIITGSRSVGGGFTTFNSATVGKFYTYILSLNFSSSTFLIKQGMENKDSIQKIIFIFYFKKLKFIDLFYIFIINSLTKHASFLYLYLLL
jgi:pectinesterase